MQITETCVPKTELQLITAARPQAASKPDADVVVPMIDQLEQAGEGPRKCWPTRSTRTGDENVQAAAARGVDLVGPVLAASRRQTLRR